jgi:hypothetical protein
MQRLEVSGAVRYIYVVRRQRVGYLHVSSITCSSSGFAAQTALVYYVCVMSVAPSENEQVILEACRGP